MDSQEEARRKFTFALMVVTAFVGLLAAVGYLSLEFGNDLARTAGIVLMFVPLLIIGTGAIYLLWRLNPLAAIAVIKQGIDWMTARWQRENSANRRISSAVPERARERPGQVQASRPGEERYWVGGGAHQQRLTPQQMVAEIERLRPLAAQAESDQRARQRVEATLVQLQAQVEQANLQAEHLAAEWTQQIVATWCAILSPQGQALPGDSDEAFRAVCIDLVRLRERAGQAETLQEQLGEAHQETHRLQQELDSARQGLEAVQTALELPAEAALIEEARTIFLNAQTLASDLEKVRTEIVPGLQQRIAELEALLKRISGLEELSDEELTAFWMTVNYGPEIIPERWPRSIEQRCRADSIVLMRQRELSELVLAGEKHGTPSSPPPPTLSLPAATNRENEVQGDTSDEEGREGVPDAGSPSSVQPSEFGQFGVRKAPEVSVRQWRPRQPRRGRY